MKRTTYYPLLRGFVLLVAAAGAAICADAGALRVGASRVEFTKLAAPPATPALGKYEHEKLYLRAIVIDNGVTRAALITVDGNSPATIPAKVAAELKCPVENVISSGTHSHSASMGGPPPGMRPQGYTAPQPTSTPQDDVALQAVREAVAKLQPARMAFGAGQSYLNVNRDAINPKTRLWTQDTNLAAPSDKTVAVLKFESLKGELIALYFNYSMHPVNGYLSGIISADFPGAASRHIEQIYGDKVVAAFSQGAEGDQNPLYLRASAAAQWQRGGQEYYGQPLVKEEAEALIREQKRPMVPITAQHADALSKVIEAEGVILAEEVLRVAHSLTGGTTEARISAAQRTITCPGRTRTNQGREGQPGTYTDGPDVNLLMRVVGIGSVGLVAVNAEVYNAISQSLKAKSPLANTVFVGLANGSAGSGYVLTDDAYGRNTFQALGARAKPGCAEASIVNTGTEMLTQYVTGLAGAK